MRSSDQVTRVAVYENGERFHLHGSGPDGTQVCDFNA